MKKIGVLDSGLGGFSVLKELLERNLEAEFYFISDNDNVPYGNKSQEFMLSRIRLMIDKLLSKSVESIVIACNTATAQTIDKLRLEYSIPFFGIEPYINYLNHSDDTDISLILTQATYNSERFKGLIKKFDPSSKIKIHPLKNLALLIEKFYMCDFFDLEPAIRMELDELTLKKGSTLILGCTHYPLIKNYLEKEYQLKVIDPNVFLVNTIIDKLNINTKNQINEKTFYLNFNAKENWKEEKIENFNLFF